MGVSRVLTPSPSSYLSISFGQEMKRMQEKTETISVRLSDDVLKCVKTVIEEHGVGRYKSVSQFIRFSMEQEISRRMKPTGVHTDPGAESIDAKDYFICMQNLPQVLSDMERDIHNLKKRIKVLENSQPVIIVATESE